MLADELNLNWHKEWRKQVVDAFLECRDIDMGEHVEMPLADWERLQKALMQAPSRTLPFVETVEQLVRGKCICSDGEWVETDSEPRPRKNAHPTVKPTDLMAYLCRLVTPPGGVVLDPFMGSGSTGKAAMREGFRFIGCELSPEYMTIARARIEDACKQPRLIMDEQPIQEQGAMFEGKE